MPGERRSDDVPSLRTALPDRGALVPVATVGGAALLAYALAALAVAAFPSHLLPTPAADAFLRRWIDPPAVAADPFVRGVALLALCGGYVAGRRSRRGVVPTAAAFVAVGAVIHGATGLLAWTLASPGARPATLLSLYAVGSPRPVVAFAAAGALGAALAGIRSRRGRSVGNSTAKG